MALNKKKAGYVYILSNPVFSEKLLKIGMTTRSPELRAKELFEGATGLPAPFKVEYKSKVLHCEMAETIVHERLANYRSRKYREFFEVDIDIAINVIEEVVAEIDALYSETKKLNPKDSVATSISDSSVTLDQPSVNDNTQIVEPVYIDRSQYKSRDRAWLIGGAVIFTLAIVVQFIPN